ncbi:hypothetical protein DAPPUDRAFT_343267, partial [Daphnia pulex]
MSKRVSDVEINSQNKRARNSGDNESYQDTAEVSSSLIQSTNGDEEESDNTLDYSTPTAVCADEFDQLDAQELK